MKYNSFLFAKIIFCFILILSTANIAYGNEDSFVVGNIFDLNGKAFDETVKVLTVVNEKGVITITEHEVTKEGKYILKVPKDRFVSLIVSIDSVQKLTIPFFATKASNYDLDMFLPKTIVPYIDFDEVKFVSKNTNLIKFLKNMNTAIWEQNSADVAFRGFQYQNDTAKFVSEITTKIENIEKLIKQNSHLKFNNFVLEAVYLNIANYYILANKAELIDTSIVKKFVENFPSNAIYLHTFPIKFNAVAKLIPDNFQNKYFQNLLSSKKVDDFLKCEVLYQAMLFYFNIIKDENKAYYFYEELQVKYADKPQALLAKDEFAPDKRIRIGKQLPDFFIPSIDNPNLNYTKNLFIGKYLLIHFWKLEDDKNINQLRYISESYDMFYEEPFEILSICLENDVEKVQNFRKTSWQMSWQNGVETMLMNAKISKLFELKQTPFCILVAPDGTIIETGDVLYERLLLSTLKKHFKSHSKNR